MHGHFKQALCLCDSGLYSKITLDCREWMTWTPAQQQRPGMSHGLTVPPVPGTAGSGSRKGDKAGIGS